MSYSSFATSAKAYETAIQTRTRVVQDAAKTKDVRKKGACYYHKSKKTGCAVDCVHRGFASNGNLAWLAENGKGRRTTLKLNGVRKNNLRRASASLPSQTNPSTPALAIGNYLRDVQPFDNLSGGGSGHPSERIKTLEENIQSLGAVIEHDEPASFSESTDPSHNIFIQDIDFNMLSHGDYNENPSIPPDAYTASLEDETLSSRGTNDEDFLHGGPMYLLGMNEAAPGCTDKVSWGNFPPNDELDCLGSPYDSNDGLSFEDFERWEASNAQLVQFAGTLMPVQNVGWSSRVYTSQTQGAGISQSDDLGDRTSQPPTIPFTNETRTIESDSQSTLVDDDNQYLALKQFHDASIYIPYAVSSHSLAGKELSRDAMAESFGSAFDDGHSMYSQELDKQQYQHFLAAQTPASHTNKFIEENASPRPRCFLELAYSHKGRSRSNISADQTVISSDDYHYAGATNLGFSKPFGMDLQSDDACLDMPFGMQWTLQY